MNMGFKLDWLHRVLVFLLLLVSVAYWYSPYRYEGGVGGMLVRTHRVTGETELLRGSIWHPTRIIRPPAMGPSIDPLVHEKQWTVKPPL